MYINPNSNEEHFLKQQVTWYIKKRVALSFLVFSLLSSCFASAQTDSLKIDEEQRRRIILKVAEAFKANYVYEDIGRLMSKQLKARLKKGTYNEYETIQRLVSRLTKDLYSISKDKHISITLLENASDLEAEFEDSRKANYGFQKIEMLPGSIGYVELHEFAHPSIAGSTARSAMQFLRNSEVLIFDLRNNGGGWSEMVQLLSSYFFEAPVHLATSFNRLEIIPHETWTYYVDNFDFSEIPIFILISKRSFSAAEAFSYQLQSLNRATIVGETSKGGAHGIEYFDEPEHGITIKIPVSRMESPITGTDWEKTGVIPDILIPEERAVQAACLSGLDSLIKNASSEKKKQVYEFYKGNYQREPSTKVSGINALQEYVGIYENSEFTIEVTLESGRLIASEDAEPIVTLVPLKKDLFETMDKYRQLVKIKRNESNMIIEMSAKFIKNEEVHEEVLQRKMN